MKQRTIVAPRVDSDFSKDGRLSYWKQVLPQKLIHYTTKSGKRATLDFNEQYLTDLAKAFDNQVLDQTPFMLADKDNEHTMDAERQRGEVTEVRLAREGETPGLYAKITFPNADAAKAVVNNPKLGVSARIREGVPMNDGTVVPRAMIHVLGTLDPQVTGMAPWVPAVDLSFDPTDNILDLSGENYEGAPVAKDKNEKPVMPTEAEIDAMSEAEVDAFLEKFAPGILGDIELPAEDADEDEQTLEADKELEPALSAKAKADIELAISRATAAEARTNEALALMAEARWEKYQSENLAAGVPPYVLDLAKPVLNRHEDMVIDLSNENGAEDVNTSEIVRQLVEGYKGTVDLSREGGHEGSIGGQGDPDAAALAIWENQFGA